MQEVELKILATAQKTTIRNAFKLWADNTCITFAETSTPANKIRVTNQVGSGCYSNIGMASNGQVMSLPANCIYVSSIRKSQ